MMNKSELFANGTLTAKQWDLLIKAQKAASRYESQYEICCSIVDGSARRLHYPLEEEVATLKKRRNWAVTQILNLNREVQMLPRFYNLKSSERVNEEREMIFDFLDIINKFLAERKLEEKGIK